MLLLRVDDEQRAGKAAHILDTAEVFLEFVALGNKFSHFLLGENVKLVHLLHLVELVKTLDSGTNRREVGQRAAQPARLDVEHAALLGFLLNSLLSLLLGAHEKNVLSALGNALHESVSFVDKTDGLFKVNDVNVVSGSIDILLHFRVPLASGVTEVHACFEQLLHRYYVCHNFCLLFYLPEPQPLSHSDGTERILPSAQKDASARVRI